MMIILRTIAQRPDVLSVYYIRETFSRPAISAWKYVYHIAEFPILIFPILC